MMNFTPELLIAYYYGEVTSKEHDEISKALENSWPLREKYRVICEGAEMLGKSMKSPDYRSLQSVLDHVPQRFAIDMHQN